MMTTRKSVTTPTLNSATESESEGAVVITADTPETETDNSNLEIDEKSPEQQQIIEKNTEEISKDTVNNNVEIEDEEEAEVEQLEAAAETADNPIIEDIQEQLDEEIAQDNLLDENVFEDNLLEQPKEEPEETEQQQLDVEEEQLLLSESEETNKLSCQSPPPTTKTTPNKMNITKNETSSSEHDEQLVVSSNKMRPVLIRGRKSIKDIKTSIIKEELKAHSILEHTMVAAIEQSEIADNKNEQKSPVVSPLKKEQKLEAENIDAVIEPKEDIKPKIKEKDEELDIKKETTKELSSDEATVSITPTCRLTRKSAAQELAATTRVTRNRHTSRSETPPMSNSVSILTTTARPRRSAATRKNAVNLVMESPHTVQKRKRATDDLSATELAAKHIKVESKDFATLPEEDAQNSDAEAFKIKQEIIESDDTMDTAAAANASASLRGRTRGRKVHTPTSSSAAALSPSTRTTRHTKLTSQSPTPSPTSTANNVGEVKRRRTGGYNTNTRSSLSLLKLNQHKTVEQSLVQTPDEEFKDSSMFEDKVENEAAQLDEDVEMKRVSNGVVEPLSVDTTDLQTVVAEGEEAGRTVREELETASTSGGSGSEKAASLSPEMVSEGVNVLSVKQFYKKPKFLENNLGIEEDPKLGGIVQKVSSGSDLTEEKQGKIAASTDDDDAEDELNLKLSDNECTNGDETADLVSAVVEPVEAALFMKSEQEESDEEDEAYCDRLIIQEDEVDEQLMEAEEENTEQKLENVAINEETEQQQEHKNKKTRNECDNIEAKLKQRKLEYEKKGQKQHVSIYLSMIDDEVETLKSAKLEQVDENKEKRLKVKDEQHAKAEFEQNNLGDAELNQDDCEVLSMIDAELKKLKAGKHEQVDDNKENVHAKPKQLDDEESNQLINKEEDAVSNSSACKQEMDIEQTPSSSNSPRKALKYDDANSMMMMTMKLEFEHDEETLRQKEQHLQNLGLLTHKAAEKRRLEFIQSSAAAVEAASDTPSQTQQQPQQQQQQIMQQRGSHKRNGKTAASASVSSAIATASSEYTGTLKTVIKLNRSAVANSTTGAASSANGCGTRKNHTHAIGKEQNSGNGSNSLRRQPLKMTFQKGRARGHGHSDCSADAQLHGEDAYYTIQNETEGGAKTSTCLNTHVDHSTNVQSHGRKTYNRSNNHHNSSTNNQISNSNTSTKCDSSHSESHDAHHIVTATIAASSTTAALNKKDEKEEILIPEKASSFKFHPGRLCEDQCYYCSGKFGLYDTPCHVGQIKSLERQQKILANEEKLTVDNCLCDACFRHVDRRANVPSYRKRLSASGNMPASGPAGVNNEAVSISEEDAAESADNQNSAHKCLVTDCSHPVAHSLRRKCIRKSVKKFLLNFDMPAGAPCVWLCQTHYDTVIQCSGCVLCKRRLGKNHMYHITSDTDRLEKALSDMGIPVQLGIGTAVCKLCRYFANLLMKPPDSTKSQKAEFVKNYRKRLLEFHNIHEDSNEVSDADESDSNGDCVQIEKSKNNNNNNNNKNNVTTKHIESTEDENKNVASPTSSIECLAETTTTAASESNLQEKTTMDAAETQAETATDLSMYSQDSNASSTPPSSSNRKEQEQQQQQHQQQQEQMSKLKAILQNEISSGSSSSDTDISNVLRANPNISMRELFPGEEDLGLHFKAPFGSNNSQRTPEGWTRVETFLQYDEPTRRLWEDLQKPYGNQSSFLRHLILLEKYFRNGDLVLAPQASSDASVYTQTVRQRLRSYDSGCQPKATSTAAQQQQQQSQAKEKREMHTVQINEEEDEQKQNSTAADTNQSEQKSLDAETSMSILGKHLRNNINAATVSSVDKLTKQLSSNAVTIIARPKDKSQQQQTQQTQQKSLLRKANELMSAASFSSNTSASNSRSILKSNLLSGINKSSVEIVPIETNKSQNVTESRQQKILDVANKLLSNQTEKNVPKSPPELVSLPRRPVTSNAPANTKRSQLLGNKMSTTNATHGNKSLPPNVVILPDILTQQERLQSKSWRPTLLPVEENQHLLNKGGPLYQTADGRRLPSLVQVQSGGKPFLISIFDYNRMCILRREKLMRDQMLKTNKNRMEAKQHQQQQQQQQQHKQNASALNKQQQQHTAQQQLLHLSLMQFKKEQLQQQQVANFKARLAAASMNNSASSSSSSSSTHNNNSSNNNNISGNNNNNHNSNNLNNNNNSNNNNQNNFPTQMMIANALAAAANNTNTAAAAAAAATLGTTWLWNNFTDTNMLMMNGAAGAKMPQMLQKPPASTVSHMPPTATITSQQQQHQMAIDNALMTKIPKSLTVIPQHKLMNPAALHNISGGGGPTKE